MPYSCVPVDSEIKYYKNHCLDEIVSPVDVNKLEELLNKVQYDLGEIQFLCDGFRNGFDLGYRGPTDRKDESKNLPFTVGSPKELWNKIMDEVELGHYAGPYEEIPFSETYVQSPIGLVPKAGNKTRLIFHLSYTFKNGNPSINQCTPPEMCSVKYNNLDSAVKDCLQLMKELGVEVLYFSKSDMKCAFRLLGILPRHRCYLVMKAKDPLTRKTYYFVDKCLPFGASISSSHFQRFSNALRFIVEKLSGKTRLTLITNYLDDFLFIYFTKKGCDEIVLVFIKVCDDIKFPLAMEKTEWSSTSIVFLGMLLNGRTLTLSIDLDRKNQILGMLNQMINKKKATVKQLQQLAGHLNFINRAIVPGRAFTRRMYAKFSGDKFDKLKQYHHIKLDREFKMDCHIWIAFLNDMNAVVHPFIDLNSTLDAKQLRFYSDTSANPLFGYGACFNDSWMFGQWEPGFIK